MEGIPKINAQLDHFKRDERKKLRIYYCKRYIYTARKLKFLTKIHQIIFRIKITYENILNYKKKEIKISENFLLKITTV
jgi:hypothetical protein